MNSLEIKNSKTKMRKMRKKWTSLIGKGLKKFKMRIKFQSKNKSKDALTKRKIFRILLNIRILKNRTITTVLSTLIELAFIRKAKLKLRRKNERASIRNPSISINLRKRKEEQPIEKNKK